MPFHTFGISTVQFGTVFVILFPKINVYVYIEAAVTETLNFKRWFSN
jgi:hypothetical protein